MLDLPTLVFRLRHQFDLDTLDAVITARVKILDSIRFDNVRTSRIYGPLVIEGSTPHLQCGRDGSLPSWSTNKHVNAGLLTAQISQASCHAMTRFNSLIDTINEAIRRLTKEFPAEIFAPSSMPVGRLTLNQETVVRVHEGQPKFMRLWCNGSHAALRMQCLRAWGFKSLQAHQNNGPLAQR